jgi:hypothetical protein
VRERFSNVVCAGSSQAEQCEQYYHNCMGWLLAVHMDRFGTCQQTGSLPDCDTGRPIEEQCWLFACTGDAKVVLMVSSRIHWCLAQHMSWQLAFAVYLQQHVLPSLLLPGHRMGPLSGLTEAGQISYTSNLSVNPWKNLTESACQRSLGTYRRYALLKYVSLSGYERVGTRWAKTFPYS